MRVGAAAARVKKYAIHAKFGMFYILRAPTPLSQFLASSRIENGATRSCSGTASAPLLRAEREARFTDRQRALEKR